MDCTNLPDVNEHGRARDVTEYYCGEWRESRLGVLYPAGGCYSHRIKRTSFHAYSEVLEPPRYVRKSRVLISTPIRSNTCFMSLHQSLQADADLRLTILCDCNEN